MNAESTLGVDLHIEHFTTLVGRYFQIRDDYQNLYSPDYTSQKGFCEDFNEGRFLLPLIHVLNNSTEDILLWLCSKSESRKAV